MYALDTFSQQLEQVESIVENLDPEGRDFDLRLIAAYVAFHQYDRLREVSAPFDRERYADALGALIDMLEARPVSRGWGEAVSHTRLLDTGGRYPSLWTGFDEKQYLHSVKLFEKRLEMNGVSPELIRGEACLDAGCGSGRYTIALARLGARMAVGLDVAWNGLRDGYRRAAGLGYGSRVRFLQGSVMGLPFPDRSFGFVVCSGVLHVTPDPGRGLRELARVLRPGGSAYVMVFGSEGLHWVLVDRVSHLVAPVPVDYTAVWLNLMGVPRNKILQYIDHWYTPIRERVTPEAFENRLRRSGFTDLQCVPLGLPYDLAGRSVLFPEDADLFGQGVLRYFAQRAVCDVDRVSEVCYA